MTYPLNNKPPDLPLVPINYLSRPNDEYVRNGGIGYPGLSAVQCPARRGLGSGSFHRARVGSMVGFRQALPYQLEQ